MKRVRNTLEDVRKLGAMPLSALIVFFASYAALVGYLHQRADFGIHSDCSICNFAEVLSFGDRVDAYALDVPQVQYLSLGSEDVIRIPLIVTLADSTRAPPF